MALFNVKAFEAEAEVLGKVRTVHYNNQGNLMIADLTVAEAKQILGMLATGLQVETFDGAQQHGYAPAPQSGPPQVAQQETPPPPQQQGAPADAKPKGKGRGKAKPKPEVKGNGAADPAPVADNVVALNPDAAAAPTGEDLVTQAAGKTKLKDVILVLRDGGFDDVDKLVAECTRIKEQVPVLAKIANIEDRVKRVWERLSA